MLDIALLLDQHFSPAVWDCLACTLSVVLRQKFGTSPVGMSWDRKNMIPTQSQLFAIPSPDQPPLFF